MFRGTYQARVDDKGRLKVPAEFKREIDERYAESSGKFYVTSRRQIGGPLPSDEPPSECSLAATFPFDCATSAALTCGDD